MKYSTGVQIIRTFCKIGYPHKLGQPSLICRNFKTMRKVLLNHAETFKIKIQNGGPNKSDVLNSESCRMHWNPNEWLWIWVHETFKVEIQKGGPNNSEFLQNWFPQKLSLPSLICRNFNTLRKVLLNHEECIEI